MEALILITFTQKSALKRLFKKIFKFIFWSSGLMVILSFFMTELNPEDFGFAPFLAYGLPAFILLNLSYLLLVFYKKKYWLICGLFLFIGLWGLKNTFAINTSNEKADLRVMSYNVRLFDVYNWLQRATWDDWEERKDNGLILDSIYKTVLAQEADILCFQEYFNQPRGAYKTKKMFKKSGYKHVNAAYSFKEKGSQYGMATFSKHPIIHKEYIPFKNAQNNGILISDIVKNSDTIRVFNMHLQSFKFGSDDYKYLRGLKDSTIEALNIPKTKSLVQRLNKGFKKRTQQLQRLLAETAQCPYPYIICTDLNEIPLSYIYEKLANQHCDAFLEAGTGLGITHTSGYPFMRIDYIFTSSKVKPTAFKVLKQELSDHYPIVADLKLGR